MTDQTDNPLADKPHSRLGIASLVIGIAVPILIAVFFLIAMLLGSSKTSIGGYIATGVVFFALSAPLIHLLGVIFGVIGWLSKKTKNLYPMIGTVLNAVLMIIGILLVLLMVYLLIDLGGRILH